MWCFLSGEVAINGGVDQQEQNSTWEQHEVLQKDEREKNISSAEVDRAMNGIIFDVLSPGDERPGANQHITGSRALRKA